MSKTCPGVTACPIGVTFSRWWAIAAVLFLILLGRGGWLCGGAGLRAAAVPSGRGGGLAGKGLAQEENQKAPESKVAAVEVTPAETIAEVGQQVKFTAVGKDASGNTVNEPVKAWFAGPFDIAAADQNGVVTVYAPGVIVVGALMGEKVGHATIKVAPPHIARIDLAPFAPAVVTGGAVQANATPRNANGDPRSDISITWASSNPAVAEIDAAGIVHGLTPGETTITASAQGVNASAPLKVVRNPIARLSVSPASGKARTGDVVHFSASAQNNRGAAVPNPIVRWSVSGPGARIYPDGGFVAELPGTYEITASSGEHEAMASLVVAPRNVEREMEVIAHVQPKDTQTAEQWIWGHYAYLSSISDKVWIYDVADPTHPQLTDTVKVDARLVNDVSVNADGKVGVLTREGASTRKNGIVFLDTSDPLHPKVASEYTATVTGGVHSAFINEHYVYLTDDATGSLRVIDFQDVKNPKEVARWQVEVPQAYTVETPFGSFSAGRYLHDDYVKDGIAYLAYWRDGLVILDVGQGSKGGSPENPKLISQLRFNYAELYGPGWIAGAHAVYRYKNYVYVGDEVFPGEFDIVGKERIPVRGIVHVVDVSDIEHPRQVATYSVPEAGSHNIWVLDDILYMGYYNGGARALDVSGELRGELYRQGREIGRMWTGDPNGYRPNIPFTWGAQPHDGLVYYNDVHTGLWITKLGAAKYKGSTTEAPLPGEAAK